VAELGVRYAKRLAATVAGLLLLLPAPAVRAEPDAPSLADSPTLTLTDLGFDPNLLFFGQVSTTTVSVPVPPGTAPVALTADAQLPVGVRGATIVATQDDQVLAQTDIPVSGPASIPLAGARIVNDTATVVLRTYLLPVDGYCLDPANPLRLSNAAVAFTGVEAAPTSIATFLPRVLRKLVIFIPPTPSQAESDATVALATSVAAYYGKQAPGIEVATWSAGPGQVPAAGGPLERHVLINERQDAAVSLIGGSPQQVPALQITAPATDLTNQARLLTSGLARYALTANAVAGPVDPGAPPPGDDTTIRALGQPGITVSGLRPQGTIPIDQTRFARAIHQVRVHLQGTYTPLPSVIGGQLVATMGGETIDHWAADPSGNIDRWVSVPDRLLTRNSALGIALNVTGNVGQCGEFQPIDLTITGDTAVQSTPAAPPTPLGFQSLPQALMPRVQVGIGSDTYADTVRAVLLMAGLQRLSSVPLQTTVMPVEQAINSQNPAVLIAPQGWNQPKLRLPVPVPDATPTKIDVLDGGGKPTSVTVDPELRFASLQTVFDGHRSVLVATSNGVPEQLDTLLNWLGGDERRWAALDGVAVLSVAGADPVTVAVPVPAQRTEPASTPAGVLSRWWWAGAAGVALAVLVAALLIARSRRSRREAAEVGAHRGD